MVFTRQLRPALVFIVLVAMILGSCDDSDDQPATTAAPTASSTSTAAPGSASAAIDLYDVSALVDAVVSGVVSVTSEQVRLDFLGVAEQVPAGAGTGIVIDGDGMILTNFHVVQDASSLSVIGRDGRTRSAELIAQSPGQDLALLRVGDAAGFEPLPLGSLEEVAVGDPAIAIGNALGLDVSRPTVSVGIVSAVGRTIRTPNGLLQDLVQTDAAINRGNSGGPLLDAAGRVVGINSAGIPGGQNLGFAIEIDTAVRFVERVRAGIGEPYLGVALVPNSPAIAERLGLAVETGAMVVDVEPGGPADRAGISQWDVITGFAGSDVDDAAHLSNRVFEADPGSAVELDVVRDGAVRQITVTVGERDLGP
jgi:serine protease Do